MRINSQDKALKNNYIQTYQFLIAEYERVNSKSHPVFTMVKGFYKAHKICAQTFLKYYTRYRQPKDVEAFLPGKRWPHYMTRRAPKGIEELVLQERKRSQQV